MASKYWIDPKLEQLPSLPWRKIHLDFHNSEHIPVIGDRFDPDEFGDRLVKADVKLILVFAKDMHGYFYYPSRYGPVHPGLKFDLLGKQVEACRKRNIIVHAYYCCTWDNYLAERHQEWLVINRERNSYLPKFDRPPGWTALCIAREDFVQLMLDHTKEFVSQYELDGVWFDMPAPIPAADGTSECFCAECLRQLLGRGLDPFDRKVQASHKNELYKSFMRRAQQIIKATRPKCHVEFNWQDLYGLAERLEFQDTIDIESVPTAFWGYYYLPLMMRYIRSMGVALRGLTGRFPGMWGDFGGVKSPSQLNTELASMVANAVRCNIGDQPPPDGRLDPAVYHIIGKSFARVKRLEPYLDQAAPVTEAVLLMSGLPLERPRDPVLYGMVKLLLESQIQFDAMEPNANWERYALVVLPDHLPVGRELADRLHAFVAAGGAIMAIDRGGLLEEGEKSWLERYGLSYAGVSPFKPAYLVPRVKFTDDIPSYEYALYEGASQWRVKPPCSVLASLGEPAFQRTAKHYTSHRQSPFDHETEYAAIARSGRVALFGFPLGLSYYNWGYWFYRRAFNQVVKDLLPAPLVETDAPSSTEVTLTHQKARRDLGRPERYMVHIVNFSQSRRTAGHPDFYDDPIPLTQVKVRLNLPFKNVGARAVETGSTLEIKRTPSGGVEVTVPRVPIHEIVCFELS